MAGFDYAGLAQVILALATLVAALRGGQDWKRWRRGGGKRRKKKECENATDDS